MKTNFPTNASAAIICFGLIFVLGSSSAQAAAAIVIPLTGVTIASGVQMNVQTTTGIGNGIPTLGTIIPFEPTRFILTFDQMLTDNSLFVVFENAGLLPNWSTSGNTLITDLSPSHLIGGLSTVISTTGPTSFTIYGIQSGLPPGASIQTLTIIPEPSSALLVAIGILCVQRRKRA